MELPIFMASSTISSSPFFTLAPSLALMNVILPGIGALTTKPPGAIGASGSLLPAAACFIILSTAAE